VEAGDPPGDPVVKQHLDARRRTSSFDFSVDGMMRGSERGQFRTASRIDDDT